MPKKEIIIVERTKEPHLIASRYLTSRPSTVYSLHIPEVLDGKDVSILQMNTQQRSRIMSNKELIILGKALQALLDLGAIDKVKEIVDLMAESPTKLMEQQDNG